jgi:hypothetical protein
LSSFCPQAIGEGPSFCCAHRSYLFLLHFTFGSGGKSGQGAATKADEVDLGVPLPAFVSVAAKVAIDIV